MKQNQGYYLGTHVTRNKFLQIFTDEIQYKIIIIEYNCYNTYLLIRRIKFIFSGGE